MIIRGRIVGVLANKLVAQDTIQQHPEILDIPVEAPIVVAGLARTGTTMLHRLIAQDPGIRSLASWEAINPAPSKRKSGQKKDPRFAQAAAVAKGLKYMSPGFFAIHPTEPDAPEGEVIPPEQAFPMRVAGPGWTRRRGGSRRPSPRPGRRRYRVCRC